MTGDKCTGLSQSPAGKTAVCDRSPGHDAQHRALVAAIGGGLVWHEWEDPAPEPEPEPPARPAVRTRTSHGLTIIVEPGTVTIRHDGKALSQHDLYVLRTAVDQLFVLRLRECAKEAFGLDDR